MVSSDLVRGAALEGIMEYIDCPSRFKPSRDVSVDRFVYACARRKLWNDVRAERRRRVREGQYAILQGMMAADSSRTGSVGRRVIAQGLDRETDRQARTALRAWLDGETGISPWLGIADVAALSPAEQRLDVARRKEKFTARVKRLARRLTRQ
jgi:hypothetical protein